MILETFYILFKSNASDVKKGTQDAKKTVDGLDKQLKSTTDLTSQVSDAFINMGRAVAVAAAGYLSFKSLLQGLQETADYSLQLGRTSKLLGVNVELLDAWSSAVQRFGGDSTTFQQSLMSLSNHLGTSFADTLRFLSKLSPALQKMSETRALRYGEMLGIDRSLILLLMQGTQEVESLLEKEKALGVVTEEDTKAVMAFNQEWRNTQDTLKAGYLQINRNLLPVLTELLKGFQYATQEVGLFKTALAGLGAGAGIAALLGIPYAAPIAAIAGFGILFAKTYDEIHTFFTDTNALREADEKMWMRWLTVIEKVFSFFSNFENFSIGNALSAGKSLHDWFKTSGFVNNALAPLGLADTQKAIDLANRSPLSSMTSQSIANSQMSSQSIDIKIDEINIETQATDAVGISQNIHKSIQEHLWQANSYFDNGVLA